MLATIMFILAIVCVLIQIGFSLGERKAKKEIHERLDRLFNESR